MGSRRIPGLILWTLFHTKYAITSEVGAEGGEGGEDSLRGFLIVSFVRGSAEGSCVRRPLLGR